MDFLSTEFSEIKSEPIDATLFAKKHWMMVRSFLHEL